MASGDGSRQYTIVSSDVTTSNHINKVDNVFETTSQASSFITCLKNVTD